MSEPHRTLYRWSRAEYDRMVDAGVFSSNIRLELVDGEIVEMSLQKSAHATAVDLVEEALRTCFGNRFYIRDQKPLAIDAHSEPEPDVAVIEGSIRDYKDHHPRTAVLLVEVSDSTLAFDRMNKAALYARNGIPEYWVLNLRDRTLEIHRSPSEGSYTERQVLVAEEAVSPLALRGTRIAVADLLP